MAVIQISRIQLRRGAIGTDTLPQLASGELGWAIDNQELYIGNGAVAEGAPAVGNTRILTETDLFSSLSLTTPYTLHGHSTTLDTGPNGNFETIRTIQNKLDDNVTVFDFGAEVNTTATTSAIPFQQAIDELYLNSGKNNFPLRFPAGTYYVTATTYIPANATLVGDGIDKTIIVSMGTGTNATIFHTHGGTASVRTTGLSIQSSDQPTNISISGFTFQYSTATSIVQSAPLFIVDGTLEGTISNCKFIGSYVKGDVTTSTYVGIQLDGNLTNKFKIKDSQFESLVYPITSNYDVTNIDITNNNFKTLYQGVTFATHLTGTSPKQFGPMNVKIQNNIFENIEREGIYAASNTATVTAIQSTNNIFKLTVATTDTGTAVTPIITFGSLGNSSINDQFDRFDFNQTTLGLTKKQLPVVDGAAKFELNYVKSITMPTSASTQTLFCVPYSASTHITIDYVLNKTGLVRSGVLTVFGGKYGSIFETSWKDDFNYIGGDSNAGYVEFSAQIVNAVTGSSDPYNDSLLIQYKNPSGAGTGTCVASLTAIW